MKFLTTTGRIAGVALVVAASVPTIAGTLPRSAGIMRMPPRPAVVRPIRRIRGRHANGPCSTNSTTGFVAESTATNVAGGDFSTVPGGAGNYACENYSGVLAGTLNQIPQGATEAAIGGGESNSATADDTFIGAGTGNTTEALDAFAGAGENNTVDGTDGAVVAGSMNIANGIDDFIGSGQNGAITTTGNGSFLGAGGWASSSTPSLSNTVSSTNSFLGAGTANYASGTSSFIGAGDTNMVEAQEGFVGAGSANNVGGDAAAGFIGGGGKNYLDGLGSMIGAGVLNQITNQYSAIAAGYSNTSQGRESFVGAGVYNVVTGNGSAIAGGGLITAKATLANQVSGQDSFIGAGDTNVIAANEASIGSGSTNTISSAATYGVIGGGARNAASAQYATVEGGFGNTASGTYAMVPGGDANVAAGTLSFAAGYHTDAAHNGTFVWSDYVSGSTTLKDTAANQFLVRASGGTTVYSNEAMTSGVSLAAGSGTWASLSDRNAKVGIVPMSGASILAKLAALPVSTWSYKTERGVRHAGPMAQDFYRAFGVGEDDRHITSIDEDGVALAAIKTLAIRERSKDARLASQQSEIAGLRAELAAQRRTSNDEASLIARLSVRIENVEAETAQRR